MAENEQDPKIIIDEDWKTQVEREREELKEIEAKEEAAAEESGVGENVADSTPSETSAEQGPLPPASIAMLISSLATQALASLGQLPDEEGKASPLNLDYAKHFVDLLAVLEEKTKGNLEEEEEKMLTEALHQLRMMYVATAQQAKS